MWRQFAHTWFQRVQARWCPALPPLPDPGGVPALCVCRSTLVVTAILEAGRKSLDHGGKAVHIHYSSAGVPCELKVEA